MSNPDSLTPACKRVLEQIELLARRGLDWRGPNAPRKALEQILDLVEREVRPWQA